MFKLNNIFNKKILYNIKEMSNLTYETVSVGIITALIGSIVIKILINFNRVDDNESNNFENTIKNWNKNYLIEISLFFTGVLIHLLLEYIGLNKWYCAKKCAGDTCKIVCSKNINDLDLGDQLGDQLDVDVI